MSALASQITVVFIVCTAVGSGADNRKRQNICAGNSPVTGEFRAQKASNAENVSIWWRHHGFIDCVIPVITGYYAKYKTSFQCMRHHTHGRTNMALADGPTVTESLRSVSVTELRGLMWPEPVISPLKSIVFLITTVDGFRCFDSLYFFITAAPGSIALNYQLTPGGRGAKVASDICAHWKTNKLLWNIRKPQACANNVASDLRDL